MKETFEKYRSLLNPTEVSSKKYSVVFEAQNLVSTYLLALALIIVLLDVYN